jgi:hypothetical protein
VVEVVARRTAVCGGHLRVSAFSLSSAATATLFDSELVLPGATDNARLRRVAKLIDEVMRTVTATYRKEIRKLSPAGSDIVAQYRLAAEYVAQLGQGYQLQLTLLTDGFQTAGFVLGSAALSEAQARALAARVSVPKLPGASVTVTGIGKVVAGRPAASVVAAGVVRFYDALCAKAAAERCTSVTDYATTGR